MSHRETRTGITRQERPDLRYKGEFTQFITLYDTLIITYNTKFMQLNSGGFRTKHTKTCINDYLPKGYHLYQKDSVWLLKTPSDEVRFFEDHMIIKL